MNGYENLNLPNNYHQHYQRYAESAKRHQSSIVFLPGEKEELAEKIVRCCRAGLGVALGNSLAVDGSAVDSNGIQVAELGGRWSHATSFNAWMIRAKTEYVFWTNSHGKRYKNTTLGEPADGCWMRADKELPRFIASATIYGQPYAVLPEAVWTPKTKLEFDFEVPFSESQT